MRPATSSRARPADLSSLLVHRAGEVGTDLAGPVEIARRCARPRRTRARTRPRSAVTRQLAAPSLKSANFSMRVVSSHDPVRRDDEDPAVAAAAHHRVGDLNPGEQVRAAVERDAEEVDVCETQAGEHGLDQEPVPPGALREARRAQHQRVDGRGVDGGGPRASPIHSRPPSRRCPSRCGGSCPSPRTPAAAECGTGPSARRGSRPPCGPPRSRPARSAAPSGTRVMAAAMVVSSRMVDS